MTEAEMDEYCLKLPRYKRPRKIFFADMFLSKSFSHQMEINAIRTKIEMLEQEANRVYGVIKRYFGE